MKPGGSAVAGKPALAKSISLRVDQVEEPAVDPQQDAPHRPPAQEHEDQRHERQLVVADAQQREVRGEAVSDEGKGPPIR